MMYKYITYAKHTHLTRKLVKSKRKTKIESGWNELTWTTVRIQKETDMQVEKRNIYCIFYLSAQETASEIQAWGLFKPASQTHNCYAMIGLRSQKYQKRPKNSPKRTKARNYKILKPNKNWNKRKSKQNLNCEISRVQNSKCIVQNTQKQEKKLHLLETLFLLFQNTRQNLNFSRKP